MNKLLIDITFFFADSDRNPVPLFFSQPGVVIRLLYWRPLQIFSKTGGLQIDS